jgi:HAE1 family hydrophobic/amphiphilic exporter-1
VILWATGTPVSVVGLIGVVMLAGVVVNNSIVLVDYANQRCDAGKTPAEAVEDAGRVRMRPILMTALTTILAMIPMAAGLGTGAQTWAPLARVVVGGLTGATVITLLFVPVAYRAFVRTAGGACTEPPGE